MNKQSRYNRWLILAASIFIIFITGGGYAWSVYIEPLSKNFGWSSADLNLTFTINMGCSPIAFLIGSRLQKLKGEKFSILAGGLVTGLGFFLSGFISSLPMLYITYGMIAGLGFSTALSAILSNIGKIFSDRRGLALGMVFTANAVGSMIIAPVASSLITKFGVLSTFKILGSTILLIVCLCSLFIKNASDILNANQQVQLKCSDINNSDEDKSWKQMISDYKYYLIVLIYATGLFSGIMLISNASPIGQGMYHLSSSTAAAFVSIIALGNGFGRIIGGWMNDKFRSVNILTVIYAATGIVLLALVSTKTTIVFAVSIIVIGFSYGACVSTIPAMIIKFYGARNFSANYGVTVIVYSIITLIAPQIAVRIKEANHGDYTRAFYICMVAIIVGLVCTAIYRFIDKKESRIPKKNQMFEEKKVV